MEQIQVMELSDKIEENVVNEKKTKIKRKKEKRAKVKEMALILVKTATI